MWFLHTQSASSTPISLPEKVSQPPGAEGQRSATARRSASGSLARSRQELVRSPDVRAQHAQKMGGKGREVDLGGSPHCAMSVKAH